MLQSPITDVPRGKNNNGFTLKDVYSHADFVTFPSLCEGFGNAFLEAIYFKKPLLVNRYPTFVKDIEPKGFDLVVMDGFITPEAIQKTWKVINVPEEREKMVNANYEIASCHFSYSMLQDKIKLALFNCLGESFQEGDFGPANQNQVIRLEINRPSKRDHDPYAHDSLLYSAQLN
jgi:hypothetical protein